MRRRDLITLLGGGAVAWPLAARAQQPMRRIGVLMGYDDIDQQARAWLAEFVQELAALGWHDGQNVRFDYRWAIGSVDRMRVLAKDLLDLQPDVIFCNTTPVTGALRQETRTVPIVFTTVSDPVGAGYVESLARPGGNITGFINFEAAMGGKWLQLLKEAVPHLTRVAAIYNPATAPGGGRYFGPSFEAAARALGIMSTLVPVRGDSDIEHAIADVSDGFAGGFVVLADGFMFVHRDTVIATAARYGVPAIYASRAWINSGGLMAYVDASLDIYRRAASYVDRILRGTKASELPVQVPTKFELLVNLKTAKALGLKIPEAFLLRADEVIE